MLNSTNEQSKDQAVPFFARFLEAQQPEQYDVKQTLKYPSDWEDLTEKYPSDWEDQ